MAAYHHIDSYKHIVEQKMPSTKGRLHDFFSINLIYIKSKNRQN